MLTFHAELPHRIASGPTSESRRTALPALVKPASGLSAGTGPQRKDLRDRGRIQGGKLFTGRIWNRLESGNRFWGVILGGNASRAEQDMHYSH